MKGQPESEVLKQCLEYLQLHGIFAFRNNTGALKSGRRFIHFGYPGSSDILGILPGGKFLAVECKREKGGKLSDLQIDFLNRIKENGGVAVCVHSVEDLKNILNSYFTNTNT